MTPEYPKKEPQTLQVVLIPVPWETKCVGLNCHQLIPAGQEAVQSPSTPNAFYHLECFQKLVRNAGKELIILPRGIRPPGKN